MLCVTAQIVRHDSKPQPGGTITYSVWIWSTVAAQQVTAVAASNIHIMRTPQFTLCPAAHNTHCTVGALPPNQAFELVVTDQLRTSAVVGHQVTLTVAVQGAGLSPANATVTTIVGQQASPTSSPLPTPPPAGTLPPSLFPSTTVTPGGLSSLFPVVTPSPTSSSRSAAHHKTRKVVGVTSSALPLDPRLIGGQLAGLAVLAAAVTMVMARLSLRSPQAAASAVSASASSSSDSSTQTSSADPAPPSDAAEADDKERPGS